mgnify:CR=1 FL=1|tara:strand:+ start:96 stop:788 length:693 start_codon:yes stop_codon:yes gene_type:complete
MRVVYTKFKVLGFCLLILVACNDDDEGITSDQVLVGENYFPLAMGQVKIYQVDSILYDDFNNSVDTLSFQRKEEVTGIFVDGGGRTSFITTLSFRTDSTASWTLIKNFTQVKLRQRVEIMEDNVTTVPLIFPFAENKRWDANAFNDFEEQTFRYKNLYQTVQINQQSYDSVATVAQIDSENLIQRIFAEEKYAPNQGLIYRKSLNLNTEVSGEIRSGFEATISLIEIQRP